MVTAVAVFAAIGAAACTSETSGQAETAGTPTSSSVEEPTEQSTSESEEPDYSIASLCELISEDEAEELGGSAEGEKGTSVTDGHAVCQWSDATSLTVGFQEELTTANADTGPGVTNTPTTIDGLTAVQSLQTDPVVLCEVLVDLPSGKLFTSGAAVLSAGEGRFDPCEVANQLSNLVIPRVKDQ